jgi:beta-N-acetylhexosaminidase
MRQGSRSCRRAAAPRPLIVAVAAVLLTGCSPASAPESSSPASTSLASSVAPSTRASEGQSTHSASPSPAPTPTAKPDRADSCAARVRTLSRSERIGQLVMAGVPSTGAGAATERRLRSARVGSVVLLGNSQLGRRRTAAVTRDLRRSVHRPDGVRLLVAVDQEGGLVQRLRGPGFDRIPSARQQGRMRVQRLRQHAVRWGRQLRGAGVDVNLAPVADVVPSGLEDVNEPIGRLRRGFGDDPDVVGRHVAAVVAGSREGGVAATLKHFPGLGAVRGNTDLVTRVVDRRIDRNHPTVRSFSAGITAGANLVMMSSAEYARIDPRRRAAYSPTIIRGMLRGDLGFPGVVISDDLTAPGLQDGSAGLRAVRFLRAGGDLVIIGNPARLRSVVAAVRARMRRDPAFAAQVNRKVERILTLKDQRGRADCRARG